MIHYGRPADSATFYFYERADSFDPITLSEPSGPDSHILIPVSEDERERFGFPLDTAFVYLSTALFDDDPSDIDYQDVDDDETDVIHSPTNDEPLLVTIRPVTIKQAESIRQRLS